ncbi:hypothetical protein BIV57_15405, partial [Mangrovactinospora gilvigrisea]
MTRLPNSSPSPRRLQLLDWRVRFAVLCLVWGCSFLFIKLGTDAFAPLQVTLGRMLFGTAVLLVVLAVKRDRLPRDAKAWGHLAVAAFFLNALPFSLFAYAEQSIPSALAGICNATTPLFGMLLSLVALREDRPDRRRVVGLGLGFAGVLVVLGVWDGLAGRGLGAGVGMALAAAASYAVGWAYVRRTLGGRSESDLSMTSAQLLLGTVQVAVAAALVTQAPTSFPAVPLLAIAALGALGTGTAFLIQYGLVAEVGPTTATMVTYFVPIISTAAGVLVLGERIGWNTPVGAAVILVGAALTRPRSAKKNATRVVASS